MKQYVLVIPYEIPGNLRGVADAFRASHGFPSDINKGCVGSYGYGGTYYTFGEIPKEWLWSREEYFESIGVRMHED